MLKVAGRGIANAVVLAAFLIVSACSRSYFPDSSLNPTSNDADEFRNNWYSKYLRAMGEPVLEARRGQRTYRFTWLRTFHHPIAIRIFATDQGFELVATELDGEGGYDPGEVLRKTSLHLTANQFSGVERLIEEVGFWQLPSHDDAIGMDGSQWIIEGVTDRYHVVDRWTPQSGAVRTIGERFLHLADWTKMENIY